MSYLTALMTDSPTNLWKLDEDSGSVAVDSVGGLNGTYQGARTKIPLITEKINGSYFDGSASNYVLLPELTFPGPQVSFEVVCRFTVRTSWAKVFDIGVPYVNESGLMSNVALANVGTSADLVFNNRNQQTSPSAGVSLTLSNEFTLIDTHHFVVTLNNTLQRGRIYKNGVLLKESTGFVFYTGSRPSCLLAKSNWPADPLTIGVLGWFSIFPIELTAQQVASHYNELRPSGLILPSLKEHLFYKSIYYGDGVLSGVTLVNNEPTACLVRVYDRKTGVLIVETTSDVTGNFSITGIIQNKDLTIIAYDLLGTKNARIYDLVRSS